MTLPIVGEWPYAILGRMSERRIITARKAPRTATGRTCRDVRVGLGAEIRRMRVDTGLSQRRLAEMASIDHASLSRIERGLREPSLAVLIAIAGALGGTLSVRLYPGTGPRLTDPIQARITEAFVRILDPRWTRMVEVPVHRPARGVIDAVIHDKAAGIVIATEIQSELRRLEQQLRWSHEKSESLPSADFWRFLDREPRIDQIMILRSTRANRQLAARFSETLNVAFPASPTEAYRALTTPDAAWPGSALLWATVENDAATILERPPRNLVIGMGARERVGVTRSRDGRP